MIAVLLATYNGAAWLPDLLDSLRRQTVADWQLLVRDDGSDDATPALLADAARRDRRITLLSDDMGRLGVTRNFGRLMQHAHALGAGCVFFADQDDVWLPDKIARQQAAMGEAEARFGADTPVLVHSDLTVVDARLRTIHPSHSAYGRIRRDGSGHEALRRLLMHNFVTGCAAAINRPLLDRVLPLPVDAVLHDWWVALCAAAFGHIVYGPEPTVLYRQHARNLVGAASLWQRVHPAHSKRRWHRVLRNFARGTRQARALAVRLRERGTEADCGAQELVEGYGRLFEPDCGAWQRFHGIRRLAVGRPGWLNRTLLAAQLVQLRRAG